MSALPRNGNWLRRKVLLTISGSSALYTATSAAVSAEQTKKTRAARCLFSLPSLPRCLVLSKPPAVSASSFLANVTHFSIFVTQRRRRRRRKSFASLLELVSFSSNARKWAPPQQLHHHWSHLKLVSCLPSVVPHPPWLCVCEWCVCVLGWSAQEIQLPLCTTQNEIHFQNF